MKKMFCDICVSPVKNNLDKIEIIMPDKVISDKTAKVSTSLYFGFDGHSSGFGGPPDLCTRCALIALDLMRQRIVGE